MPLRRRWARRGRSLRYVFGPSFVCGVFGSFWLTWSFILLLYLVWTLRLTHLSAPRLPPCLLPPRQRLHPRPLLSTRLQTPLQHLRRRILPRTYAWNVLGTGAAECGCDSDVGCCREDEGTGDEDALGCVCVSDPLLLDDTVKDIGLE